MDGFGLKNRRSQERPVARAPQWGEYELKDMLPAPSSQESLHVNRGHLWGDKGQCGPLQQPNL